jgi:hypothetical protein
MNVRETILRGQARTVEEAVEAWKAEHRAAMVVRDLEEVVRLAVALTRIGKETFDHLLGELFALRVRDPYAQGERMDAVIRTAQNALRLVDEAVHLAQNDGYEIDGSGGLRDALAEFARQYDLFLSKWPKPKPDLRAAARADMLAGRSKSVQEVVDELRRRSPAEDRP